MLWFYSPFIYLVGVNPLTVIHLYTKASIMIWENGYLHVDGGPLYIRAKLLGHWTMFARQTVSYVWNYIDVLEGEAA